MAKCETFHLACRISDPLKQRVCAYVFVTPYHGVEAELLGQDVAAGQAVGLAVALSGIAQAEQQ